MCVILCAGFAPKLTELMSKDGGLSIKNIKCKVTMHAKFGQSMPMSKVEKESQVSKVIRLWKEIFKY